MEISEFAVDVDLYEQGKRIEFGATAHICIRSAGSDRAQKVRERLWKPYATWKDVPPEMLARINCDWLAQGLLTEFVGFTDGGTAIEVDLSTSEDQKRLAGLLGKPKFKAFRTKMLQIALEDANFQAAADEALEKNSASTPAGGSAGGGKPKS
jgi:hypothetical protein